MAEFPYPGLAELRERFTWNVQPLSSTFRLFRSQVQQVLGTDPEDSDAVDSFACLANIKTSGKSIVRLDGFLSPPLLSLLTTNHFRSHQR